MKDPEVLDPKALAARLLHEQGLANIANLQSRGFSVLPGTFNAAGIALDTGPTGVDRALPETITVWKSLDGADDVWDE